MNSIKLLQQKVEDIDFKLNNTNLPKKPLQQDRAFYVECLSALKFKQYAYTTEAGRKLIESFNNE